jgi:hypothetical protein
VERALNGVGFRDFKVIARGEARDEQMRKLIEAKVPRVKVLKLHGSLESVDQFLFATSEINDYPEPVRSLVETITGSDLLVCGYAFNDVNMHRAFASRGGAIVCVDPGGVPSFLRGFLPNRNSERWGIELRFDEFFEELHQELLEPRPPAEPPPKLPPNPFKFLESYDEADAGGLPGRDEDVAEFHARLEKRPPPQVVVIAGPEKAGKTSLVRAGLIPRLAAPAWRPLYVVCPADLDQGLPAGLGPHLGAGDPPADLPAALGRLGGTAAGGRVVLFLDQFERAVGRFKFRTREGQRELAAYLANGLLKGVGDNLTLVLVVVEEEGLGGKLCQVCMDSHLTVQLQELYAFESEQVEQIVGSLAGRGGRAFEPAVLKEVAALYERGRTAATRDRFTLAHVQALCHVLARSPQVAPEAFRQLATPENLNLLNQAINVHDIMGFVEGFTWPHGVWLRNLIKVPLQESKDRIAQFIKAHYQDLVPQANGGGRQP